MLEVRKVEFAKSLVGYIKEEVTFNGNSSFDLWIVCGDGSFKWSKFLLSSMGNPLRSILQSCDNASHMFLPDFSVEEVKLALHKILTPRDIIQDQFLIFLYSQNKSNPDIYETSQVKLEQDIYESIEVTPEIELEPLLEKIHSGEDYERKTKFRSKKSNPKNLNKEKCSQDKIDCDDKERKTNKLEDQFDAERGCFICNKVNGCVGLEFDDVSKLRKHIKKNHHGYFFANGLKVDGIWNCRHCPQKFPFRRNLQEHLENNHIEKLDNLEICDICGKKLRSKAMKSHISEHQGPVKCPNCNKMYSTKASLDIHIKFLHKDVLLVFCDTCGMSFKTKQLLKRHINGVHKKLRRYQCLECGDRFLSKANLVTHCKGRHGPDFKENLMKVLSENEACNNPPILNLKSRRPPKMTKHQLQKMLKPVALPKIKNLIESDHLVRGYGPLAVAAEVSITTSVTEL